MKALGLVVSEKKIFLCFSHCKSMGANDPRGGAIFDPRGVIGRIYKEDHYTLLHTKYEGSGPCGFGEEDFSSPEPKAHRRAYSIPMLRRPSVVVVVRHPSVVHHFQRSSSLKPICQSKPNFI